MASLPYVSCANKKAEEIVIAKNINDLTFFLRKTQQKEQSF